MLINDFCVTFLIECLNKIALLDNTSILMGDFSIDVLKSCTKNFISKFCFVMTSCIFVPYIQQPTRFVGSSTTLIDNIFINPVTLFQATYYISLIAIYCNSLSLRISGHLTGQNMTKYSNLITLFVKTINLKTKVIK